MTFFTPNEIRTITPEQQSSLDETRRQAEVIKIIRGAEFELDEERIFAAEQERMEERDEMRRRFGGARGRASPFRCIAGGFESFTKGGV